MKLCKVRSMLSDGSIARHVKPKMKYWDADGGHFTSLDCIKTLNCIQKKIFLPVAICW